jgi:nuclear transport factor 2 (NTF2) superfamily protein
LDYRLKKELWCLQSRYASINDLPIKEEERKFRWERV